MHRSGRARPRDAAAPAVTGRSGVVAALALGAALVGTLAWLEVVAGPWRLASGLLGAGTHLRRAWPRR
jgi:hypothetical protein